MQYKQDLHIHTTFSCHDSAVVPEQTVAMVAAVRHAEIIGISDHFEAIWDQFETYWEEVKKHGFHLGTEVDGSRSAKEAASYPFEYYLYHCRDRKEEYRGAEILLQTGKPVIISHPQFMGTDLNKVSPACIIEINNRYVWRDKWHDYYTPFLQRFRFMTNSDAHQPNWLSLSVADYVAKALNVETEVWK